LIENAKLGSESRKRTKRYRTVARHFLCVGNFTLDEVDGELRPGGSVFYSGATAHALGWDVRIVTSASEAFPLSTVRKHLTAEIKLLPSEATTIMKNVSLWDERHLWILEKGNRIPATVIPDDWKRDTVVLLCPVFDELDAKSTRSLRGSLTGASIQGWLRRQDADGRIVCSQSLDFLKWLEGVDVLFFSSEDIREHPDLAKTLHRAAPIVVETMGSSGVKLTIDGTPWRFSEQRVPVVDTTGAGDTFAAAFLSYLVAYGDPRDAAKFGLFVAGTKVQKHGPLGKGAIVEFIKNVGTPS